MFLLIAMLASAPALAHDTTPRTPAVTHSSQSSHNSLCSTPSTTPDYHWVYEENHAGPERSRWSRRSGQHPHRTDPNWIWAPAHTEGFGRRRHVVPGHWTRKPATTRPRTSGPRR
jgi:hypothetical protein